MKKHYKGCIFDLDGTLVDTISDISDSINEALELHGYKTWEEKDYMQMVGTGFRNLVIKALPAEKKQDEETIGAVLHDYDAAYARLYLNKSKPYPGMAELLKTLESLGIPMAVNSNKRNDYTQNMISKLFPGTQFVGVFGERINVPKKPDPATALELAETMGFKPEEMLYIGDSNVDMQTGINAGMDTIGCAWGFRGRKELEGAGATYIAETAADILAVLRG